MRKIDSVFLKRKSCRRFLDKRVDNDILYTLIESARMAPSRKNMQPWRFVIVKDVVIKDKISSLSIYNEWMRTADAFIVVYLDRSNSYDERKDNQGIGAAIENICLQAASMGIGTCWIGEILKNENIVNDIIDVPSSYELMAIVCVGYSQDYNERASRLPLEELIYKII